jgi:hypothetical protein
MCLRVDTKLSVGQDKTQECRSDCAASRNTLCVPPHSTLHIEPVRGIQYSSKLRLYIAAAA